MTISTEAKAAVTESRIGGRLLILLVAVMLAGLPLAVWLDISSLSRTALSRQAEDLSSVITGIRGYYASNVVGRILAAHGKDTKLAHNYEQIPGAIPIPATLSLELGRVISERQDNITYRFVSDLPFKNRPAHPMDGFEQSALAKLRATPDQTVTEVHRTGFSNTFRLVTPIIMGPACVTCHNSHPESPKTDWKVGDVRGIQEVIITQPFAGNIFSFKYLLIYFFLVAVTGSAFLAHAAAPGARDPRLQPRAGIGQRVPRQHLAEDLALSLAADLQEHFQRRARCGGADRAQAPHHLLLRHQGFHRDHGAPAARGADRDAERVPDRDVAIALKHGGTVDKFIGDAILVFFGDPETKGAVEDAKACLRMAVDMQKRLGELKSKWRGEGTEEPFVVRMGINSGYCNVGNFGSNDRMDYTIIGAEANLAARLQSIAEGGKIVISYETFALVQDIVVASPLPPITMKGIRHEVVPYEVDGLVSGTDRKTRVLSEHVAGLDLHLDLGQLAPGERGRVREALAEAMAALDASGGDKAAGTA